MESPLWFIDLLREQPLVGFVIGLLFAGVMFGSKNLVIYLYDRHRRKQHAPPSHQRP